MVPHEAEVGEVEVAIAVEVEVEAEEVLIEVEAVGEAAEAAVEVVQEEAREEVEVVDEVAKDLEGMISGQAGCKMLKISLPMLATLSQTKTKPRRLRPTPTMIYQKERVTESLLLLRKYPPTIPCYKLSSKPRTKMALSANGDE